jgi:Skp family chaperone for outer membrane proteins
LVLSGIALAAVAGLVLTQGVTAQQAGTPPVVVGTYQPQQVAEQSPAQAKLSQRVQGLQAEMQQAQQAGDQTELQRLQAQAQQAQQDAAAEFQSAINSAMPGVAESAGAQIIAVEVAYTAPNVQTVDVTQQIIREMQSDTEPELVAPPQPQQ